MTWKLFGSEVGNCPDVCQYYEPLENIKYQIHPDQVTARYGTSSINTDLLKSQQG